VIRSLPAPALYHLSALQLYSGQGLSFASTSIMDVELYVYDLSKVRYLLIRVCSTPNWLVYAGSCSPGTYKPAHRQM